MMSSIWAITFLCAFAVARAQNGYSRDNPSNQLGYNPFGQAISDEDQSNGDEIPGEAGRDYPAYDKVPDTGFSCNNQQYPGYYADPESQCQAFYVCQKSGRGAAFLCPTGSIFNQESLVCDWWYNVDCSRAEEQYSVNEQVSRAMEEADARLSEQQQQGGYNYDAPGTSGNGAVGQYNQGPSSSYGVPSKGSNGNGFNQNGQNGQNKLSSVYGVPGQTGGSPFGQSQNEAAGQYNQGPSSSYGVPSRGNNGNGYNQNGKNGSPFGQSQNGFNGAASNNGRQNGNRPSQNYGVPSTNGAFSQRYSSNGNGNGKYNGNGNGNGFNGNTPKPVYGPPTGLNGPGIQYSNGPSGNGNSGYRNGNGKNTESFHGFNGNNRNGNVNGQAFRNGLGNAPSSVERSYLPPSGTGFSNGNSPSSQYGVPGQSNGGFNAPSGQGNFNGSSPDRSYLLPSK